MKNDPPSHTVLTLRHATAADAAAVAALAQLDSARVPAGDLLLAIVDGEAVAALSLQSGALVADPFRRTADVARVLRERAASLRDARADAPARRRVSRRTAAGLVPWARVG